VLLPRPFEAAVDIHGNRYRVGAAGIYWRIEDNDVETVIEDDA